MEGSLFADIVDMDNTLCGATPAICFIMEICHHGEHVADMQVSPAVLSLLRCAMQSCASGDAYPPCWDRLSPTAKVFERWRTALGTVVGMCEL